MFGSKPQFIAVPDQEGLHKIHHARRFSSLPSRAHWKAPCLMVVTLICGVSLAYGHHRFFSSLAGHQVQSGDNAITISDMSVSQQRFNTAIGTTFAFLVKSCLTLAVTTAYVQLFWKSIGKTAQHTKISTINTLSSATSNPLNLAFLSTWIKYPVLLTLAVLPW